MQILEFYKFAKILIQALWRRSFVDTKLLKYFHQYCFESFKIPVLIDDLMDDSSLKHLMSFKREQVQKIVHIIYEFRIFHIFPSPLR